MISFWSAIEHILACASVSSFPSRERERERECLCVSINSLCSLQKSEMKRGCTVAIAQVWVHYVGLRGRGARRPAAACALGLAAAEPRLVASGNPTRGRSRGAAGDVLASKSLLPESRKRPIPPLQDSWQCVPIQMITRLISNWNLFLEQRTVVQNH